MSRAQFRVGGTGIAEDWEAIRAAILELRLVARAFLQDLDEEALDVTIPYDGSLSVLHESGLNLRHALLRICAHHYFHIGEIATKRDQLGHPVGDYPGPLTQSL